MLLRCATFGKGLGQTLGRCQRHVPAQQAFPASTQFGRRLPVGGALQRVIRVPQEDPNKPLAPLQMAEFDERTQVLKHNEHPGPQKLDGQAIVVLTAALCRPQPATDSTEEVFGEQVALAVDGGLGPAADLVQELDTCVSPVRGGWTGNELRRDIWIDEARRSTVSFGMHECATCRAYGA